MKTAFTFLFLLFSPFIFSQTGFWLQGIGGNNVDESMSICRDASGNYITAGYFSNTATFTSITNTLTANSIGIPDIYVQKSSPAGNVLWKVKAGGNGTDRALGVACDNAGNIYVTGFYYGTATFGSITLTSASGSQDMFVAKLDATGSFLWAKSAGGSQSEWGNSIAVDNAGNVFVTGQFKGTCSWSSISKTSMTNPSTGQSSFDIFTAKYDTNGNVQWVETGSAEFDDRGLDIATDANGDVYVCGQFSDTIVFNNVHNNPVMNAVFLIKYNTNGAEQWFRRASSSYSIAYGLCTDNQQNIYLTGDFKGNMVFNGTPNNFINSTYSNSVFIAKYSSAGTYLWGDSDGSDSYLSSRDCAVDALNNVYLQGEFGCVMDEYSAVYGPGVFNSVGYQDIFCVKYSDTGIRQWFRQFGGPGNDKAHGLVLELTDKPVMTGSFEKRISVPSSNPYIVHNAVVLSYGTGPQGVGSQLCGDPFYFSYSGLSGAGFSDAYIINGVDLSREPYDYYNHYSASCVRDFVGTCITTQNNCYGCNDTIEVCQNGKIFANTNTGVQGYIGPLHHFQWSTGGIADTLQQLNVSTSGYYSVNVATMDGCFSDTDSVFVIVHPLPQHPKITDNLGFNINQPPATDTVQTCHPDTVILSVSNLQNCTISWMYQPVSYYWNPYLCYNGSQISTDDSTAVNVTGYYTALLTDSFGCSNCTSVWVQIDSVFNIGPKTNFPDTIVACFGDNISFTVFDSITNPGGNPSYCLGNFTTVWSTSSPLFNISYYLPNCTMSGQFSATMPSGTYTVNEMIIKKNLCQNDTFYISKTFYIQVNPLPSVSISVTGPNDLCPGDSLNWTVSVSGVPATAQITSNPPPGNMIVTSPGSYYFTATIIDTSTGCSAYGNFYKLVAFKPDPVISTIPPNAIICPNDSALISCNLAGTNYEWHGPNGLLSPVTQSIYDSVPGFYHCVVTDATGCVLTSNTVELRAYSTPYLEASPSAVICSGNFVTLNVISLDYSQVQWLPPLSGSAQSVTVTSGGTYQCYVTLCGIQTLCSIDVIIAAPDVFISASDTVICAGDSSVLTAGGGSFSYSWMPGNLTTPSIVAIAGTYSLTVTDQYGCQDNTSFTVLSNNTFPVPTVSAYTVCYGDSVTATANGGGLAIEWFSDAGLQNQIGSGSTIVYGPCYSDTVIYASAVGAGSCNSIGAQTTIDVNTASAPPVLSGDTLVCAGDALSLSCSSAGTINYNWTGPAGFSSAQQSPVITNASAVNSGTYSLTTSNGSCISPPATWQVQVITVASATISGDDTICASESLVLNASSVQAGVITWYNNNSQAVGTGNSLTLSAPSNSGGWYTTQLNYMGCLGTVDSFYVTVLPNPTAPSITVTTPLCVNDTAYFFADTLIGYSYNWSGPDSFVSSLQNPVIANTQNINQGLYSLIVYDGFCPSSAVSVSLTVNPLPDLFLGNDTIICEDDNFQLNAGSGYVSYLWENTLSTQTHPIHFPGSFYVTVIDSLGCEASDTITVNFMNCRPQTVNVFTPNGDGINDKFTFGGELFKEVECTVFDRWGVIVFSWNGAEGYWDGKNQKNGLPVPDGTYFYSAGVVDKDGNPFVLQGYITLSR